MKRLRFKSIRKDEIDRGVIDQENIDTTITTVNDNYDGIVVTKDDSFAVTDNVMVEQRLGHLGMLCIEDVIDVVKNCSPQFHELIANIAAFRLGDILKAEG